MSHRVKTARAEMPDPRALYRSFDDDRNTGPIVQNWRGL